MRPAIVSTWQACSFWSKNSCEVICCHACLHLLHPSNEHGIVTAFDLVTRGIISKWLPSGPVQVTKTHCIHVLRMDTQRYHNTSLWKETVKISLSYCCTGAHSQVHIDAHKTNLLQSHDYHMISSPRPSLCVTLQISTETTACKSQMRPLALLRNTITTSSYPHTCTCTCPLTHTLSVRLSSKLT